MWAGIGSWALASLPAGTLSPLCAVSDPAGRATGQTVRSKKKKGKGDEAMGRLPVAAAFLEEKGPKREIPDVF